MQEISIARLGGLGDVRLTVARQPMPTVLSLAADVLGAIPQGLPPSWRTALRRACPPHAQRDLSAAFAPGALWVPDCLSPRPWQEDEDMEAQFERMRAVDAAELHRDLCADFPGGLPVRWQRVVDDPEGFVRTYTSTLRALWLTYAPVWRRAGDLLHRETSRIGTASVTGMLSTALAGLGPRTVLVDDALRIPDPCATTIELGDRRLVLVPLTSGRVASVLNLDQPDCIWIGYPVPGVGQLWSSDAAPVPAEPLAALLGPLRAQLLVLAGRSPSMGRVAVALGCSPSAATHHCGRLETAGLVIRERQGKRVVVHRTERGDELIDTLIRS